jgi:hypothetical protein
VAAFHTNGFTWLYIKAESKKQGINTLNFMVQILEKDGNKRGIAYFCTK